MTGGDGMRLSRVAVQLSFTPFVLFNSPISPERMDAVITSPILQNERMRYMVGAEAGLEPWSSDAS